MLEVVIIVALAANFIWLFYHIWAAWREGKEE